MIFIDTGAFLGRYSKRDQHHARAVRGFEELRAEHRSITTSNHVLSETFTLLGRRMGYRFAAERGRSILASDVLRILRPGPEEEIVALDEMERFADQQVSFTDCLSFVLMRREGILDAFSFDRHFLLAGFRLWPEAT